MGCCYCDTQLEYGQLTVHYEMCDSYPVDCPHQCGVTVARKDVESMLHQVVASSLKIESNYKLQVCYQFLAGAAMSVLYQSC